MMVKVHFKPNGEKTIVLICNWRVVNENKEKFTVW